MKKKKPDNTASWPWLFKRLSRPAYQGKHIIAIHGRVFTTTKGKEVSKLLEKLTRKYPSDIPTITYIPTSDALVLMTPWKK